MTLGALARPVPGAPPDDPGPASHVRGDIQGLRAVAVLGVLVYHAGSTWLPGGYVGVDVFFVISGFVITSQLLRKRRDDRIRLLEFYANRVRRLLPMSTTVLVCTLIAAHLLLPPLLKPEIVRDARATALYLANMLFAWKSTDYWSDSAPSLFQHYWSLAVEEQFYLVWPLLLAGLLALARRRSGSVIVGVAVLTAVSFLACVVMTSWRQPWAFFTLPPRAWELGVGALIAVVADRVPASALASRLLGWTGLAGVALSMWFIGENLAFPGLVVAAPVLSTALVIIAGINNPTIAAGRALSFRPLRYIGDISYSLYLWHWPVLLIPRLRGETDLPATLGLLGLSLLLAAASYRLIEQPLRRAAPLSGVSRPMVFAVVSLVVTLAATVPVSRLGRLSTDQDAPALTSAQLVDGDWPVTSYVPRNLRPSLRAAASDLPAAVEDGCHLELEQVELPPECEYRYGDRLRIAVYGDSHVLQWFPALDAEAERHGWTILTLTKATCPSFEVTTYNVTLARTYTECESWRTAALQRLDEFQPDVVVTGNWTQDYGVKGGDSFESDWSSGGERMFDALPPEAEVVVLGDTPRWSQSPSVCLSDALTDTARCALPSSRVVHEDFEELDRTIAMRGGARFVPTSRLVCRDLCPPILGNVLVYRDYHHVTATMAELLGSRLSEEAGLVRN